MTHHQQSLPPTLPVTVTVPFGYKSGYFFRYGIFFVIGMAIVLSVSSLYIRVPLVVLLVGFCASGMYHISRQHLTLSESTIESRGASSTQTIAYKDIEKLGYYYTYVTGKGGSVFKTWLECYLRGAPNPIKVFIGSFTERDVLTVLHVIMRKNPNVQVGDNLAQALTTGVFPKKRPVMTIVPATIQDTHFAPIRSERFMMPEQVSDSAMPVFRTVTGLLVLAIVLVAAYAFLHRIPPLFGLCVAAIVVLSLVGWLSGRNTTN